MIFDYIPYDMFIGFLDMINMFELIPVDNTVEMLNTGVCTRDCD